MCCWVYCATIIAKHKVHSVQHRSDGSPRVYWIVDRERHLIFLSTIFVFFFFGYFSTERANQFHHITSQANTNFQTDIIDHMQLYLFMLVHIYVNGQDKHFIQIHLCFVFNFKWKISGNVSIADGVQHWFLKFCCSVNCKELKSFGKAQYYWKFNFNVDSEIEV